MGGHFYSVVFAAAVLVMPSLGVPSLTLSWTGSETVTIPRMLLGTGGGNNGYDCSAWLAAGGPGFDSAQTYCYTTSRPFCSHVAISNALGAPGAPPVESLFLISKVEPEDFGVEEVMSGFGRVVDRGILQDLSVSRIDMLMAHQAGRAAGSSNVKPLCYNASAGAEGSFAVCRSQMMRTFLALVAKGDARSIAVSNWQVRDLQQAFDEFGVYPSANEIEIHPWWHEDDLIAFCKSHNITIINYAPLALATDSRLADPDVVAVAAAHAITPAQALLAWGLQWTGGVVIPRSSNATHMRDNLAVFDKHAQLTPAELALLAGKPQKKIFNVYCQPAC